MFPEILAMLAAGEFEKRTQAQRANAACGWSCRWLTLTSSSRKLPNSPTATVALVRPRSSRAIDGVPGQRLGQRRGARGADAVGGQGHALDRAVGRQTLGDARDALVAAAIARQIE